MREFSASFVERSNLIFKFWFDEEERREYDQFEVWRSTAGQGGPYTELTGDVWGPAVLEGRRAPGTLVGKSLNLLVGTHSVDVTFTGTDPLSLPDIAAQVTAAGAGLLLARVVEDGLRIQTSAVGCLARLEVIGGDAAPILGFSTYPPTNRAYGTDARPRFTPGVGAYEFGDQWSSSGYYYKTRLRRGADGAVSEFSNPFTGNPTRAVPHDSLVMGWLRLVDVQGRPVSGRSILVSTRDTVHMLSAGEYLVDFSDQVLATDTQGYASLLLLRGVKVTIGVAGTSLVRDVTPPTDPSIQSFNLFDGAYSTDDAFNVQVPDINIAERRNCP